jgi:transposase
VSVCVIIMMNTDTVLSCISADAATAAGAVPVVVIPVNQGPVDTGIRVPVERITVEELARRQQAERAERLDQTEPVAPTKQVECDGPAAEASGLDPRLPTNVAVLQRMVNEMKEALAGQRLRTAELEQVVQCLESRLHRQPREVWSKDQPPLFPDMHPQASDTASAEETTPTAADTPADPPATTLTTEPDAAKKRTKKKHGRRSLAELAKTLPRERREHPLTEAERLCPCCGKLRCKIGEQTTYQVEYVPAKLICLEHAQFTYSCTHCPEHIVTAPKPPQPIDRGLPGPALCALVTASKFDDYLPLYRQELILSRYGLFFARSTLCDWLMALGDLVKPLVARMKADIFQSRVLQTDGTSIEVLLEKQPQTRTGYFWPYLGDDAHPGVVVDFSLDKRKEHPQSFLAGFTGYVQVDAYSAYDGCFICDANASHPKVEVGCWSHTERYFEAALATNPAQAAEGLAFIRSLFTLEAHAKRDHLSETEVLALRQREAAPILDEFKKWLERVKDEVLPKSPLADAIRYTRNQWEALRRYTEAGYLAMDNNGTERINKLMARGRVNWLFVGSPRGGETAALLLSLVVTCRRLHMDSFAYLRDVFTRLPGMLPSQLDELLPHRWLATHPEARHPPQRCGHGHGDPSPRRRRRPRPA